MYISPWSAVLFIDLDCFGVSCPILKISAARDVGLLLNIMEVNGTHLVALKSSQEYILKNHDPFYSKISTNLAVSGFI